MHFRPAAVSVLVCVRMFAAGIAVEPTAEVLMADGHWKQARSIVEAALKTNPQDARLLHLMSRIKWAFGDQKAALDFADRAIAMDNNKPAFHAHAAFMYGQMLNDAGGIGKVIILRHFRHEIEETLALDSKNIDALLMRAVFLAAAPRFAGGDIKQADRLRRPSPASIREKETLRSAGMRITSASGVVPNARISLHSQRIRRVMRQRTRLPISTAASWITPVGMPRNSARRRRSG